MNIKQFPQINRKLTALVLLVCFFIFILANFLQNLLFETSGEKNLRMEILRNPQIASFHEKLGQYYLEIDSQAAKREYALAQEYYVPFADPIYAKVLGIQATPRQTWQNIEAKMQNLDSETLYWEKVKELYPDYLYADIKLALLSLQKGNSAKAKNYLSTVIEKDPTDKYAAKLLEKLP